MPHLIPFEQAIAMTQTYRQQKDNILQEQYRKEALLPLCETFDKKSVEALLSQAGCESLRIYYGMQQDLSVHAILVGVDADGNDMLPAAVLQGGDAENNGELLEDAQRCPINCPSPSPLNR
ncbi:hypothetical protein [Aridibaculum aurantiacum]|uniref:hypothetical protein n=1 Tax=Aridibaculum aurantiacum TaxID=2810307 RepID=UPI001A95F41B|nr:hypothetical protein [Aridibaculum aurantiacum]